MAVANPNVRFRYEDYKTLPETGPRCELLDGDLILVPAPTPSHQRISRNLEVALFQFIHSRRLGEVFDAPIDVVLGEGDNREVVQPDLLVIGREQHHIVTDEEIRGAPNLVVEILSPRTKDRDRGYKKALYARHGVKEYWLIDPASQMAEVYVPGGAGFELAGEYQRDSEVVSVLFPELRIGLEQVFALK